jgi:hypothetical protein
MQTGYCRKPLRSIGFVAVMLLACAPLRPAFADALLVRISSEPPETAEYERRLAAELVSEGYTVEVDDLQSPIPCDGDVGERSPELDSGSAQAWVHLKRAAPDLPDVMATICYRSGDAPFQRSLSLRPRPDPRELAVAAAEALNGLHAKVPNAPEPAFDTFAETGLALAAPAARVRTDDHRVFLGPAILRDVTGKASVFAVLAGAYLGIADHRFGILVDALWPVRGTELVGVEASAEPRLAWLRLGLRGTLRLKRWDVSGAVLAGPALIWARATTVRPPKIGAADVGASASFGVHASLAYRTSTPIFLYAATSMSTLLPRIEVDLGAGPPSRLGALVAVASVGLGARWGESQ